MNEPKNHTTKADFVEALNGEHTANTLDQLSLDVEPAKTIKKGHRLLLTDYGVKCVLSNYRQSENVSNAAQAGGISHATLNRILRNTRHPNHAALVPHLPTPRRYGSAEYLKHEREIARTYQAMKKDGASFDVIAKYLRGINFRTGSNVRAVDMSNQALNVFCRDFLEVYDFEKPTADEPDQVKPDELPSSDFALSAQGDLILRLIDQLTAVHYLSKRLITAIGQGSKDKAAHYAYDLHCMIYKAMTDAKQEN